MGKGTIYNENEILIEKVNIEEWSLFERELISELHFKGRVVNKDGEDILLAISIDYVCSPQNSYNNVGYENSVVLSPNKKAVAAQNSFRRAELWFFNYLIKNVWVMMGKIGNSNTEITILYYENVHRACYSLKTIEERAGTIFQNPQQN